MASLLVGHVAIGIGFFFTGLWHLFNHIKLHTLHPTTYTSLPWFPTQAFRYLEPVLISAGSTIYIIMELFISPSRHQPLDNDWTIPSYHLHNFEHSTISLNFLIYSLFSIIFDRVRVGNPRNLLGLMHVIGLVVFFQELLLIHLHSTDHAGIEGQYHWLQQVVISVTLISTLLGIGLPKSFLVSFVKSVSIAIQGVWYIVMGFALWSPGLIPKGCSMSSKDGHVFVKCRDHNSLERAKALANLEFSWVLAYMMIFSMVLYLTLSKYYVEQEYVILNKDEEDLESQKKLGEESESFVQTMKSNAIANRLESA